MNKIVGLTCIVYKEDITENAFDEVLLYFPMAISPLHDQDVYEQNTDTHGVGELKKAHYHICFSSNLTSKQKKIFCRMVGIKETTFFQKIQNGEGMLKYLTHETEKAKKQGKHIYNKEDIRISENFDENQLMSIGNNDYISEMVNFIVEKNIFEFYRFMEEVLKTDDENFIEFCFKNELKAKHFIDSRRCSRKENILK